MKIRQKKLFEKKNFEWILGKNFENFWKMVKEIHLFIKILEKIGKEIHLFSKNQKIVKKRVKKGGVHRNLKNR